MGFFRSKRPPPPPPPEQEAYTLELDQWSFVSSEGETIDGEGYRFVGADGEPLYGHEEENWQLEWLDGLVTNVVGVTHHHDALQTDSFEPGQPLRLVPEPDNPYDGNAVAVWDAAGTQTIGHLPREVAAEVSAAMRVGLNRDALALWEWRTQAKGRIGLKVVVAPGIAKL